VSTKIAVAKQETTNIILDIGAYTFLLSREEAIELSAKLAFMADGCLVSDTDNGKVVRWNTRSRFHEEYRKRMENERRAGFT
jgi:hypothetical protein